MSEKTIEIRLTLPAEDPLHSVFHEIQMRSGISTISQVGRYIIKQYGILLGLIKTEQKNEPEAQK